MRRFEVLTVALLKIQIPWDVTLCRWIWNTRRQCNILEEMNFYACVSFATCARPFICIQEKSRITEQIFVEYYVYGRFVSQFVYVFHFWLNSKNKDFYMNNRKHFCVWLAKYLSQQRLFRMKVVLKNWNTYFASSTHCSD